MKFHYTIFFYSCNYILQYFFIRRIFFVYKKSGTPPTSFQKKSCITLSAFISYLSGLHPLWFSPCFQCIFVRTAEPFSFFPVRIRCTFLQDAVCLTHSTSSGSCKCCNFLSCEIITLKKCIDNGRCHIPPDWELKCSQSPTCVDFTGFNGIQNCVLCNTFRILS